MAENKKDARMELKLPADTMAALKEIQAKHVITPQDVARELIEAAVSFYREHGYFAFPVKILPEKEFLAAVMKTTEAAEVAELAEKLPKPKPRKAG